MPVAGVNRASRADAHLRWAYRYNEGGHTRKAAAHFGRALEYSRGGKQVFGARRMSATKAGNGRTRSSW